MSIMRVLVVELLYQTVMGRIPVLECLMPEVCRCLWLCLILSGIKCHCYPRTETLRTLVWYLGYPRAWLPGARAHVELGCEDKLDWADRW
jgi:hypothetical protein